VRLVSLLYEDIMLGGVGFWDHLRHRNEDMAGVWGFFLGFFCADTFCFWILYQFHVFGAHRICHLLVVSSIDKLVFEAFSTRGMDLIFTALGIYCTGGRVEKLYLTSANVFHVSMLLYGGITSILNTLMLSAIS
jgi:hypothetical protein